MEDLQKDYGTQLTSLTGKELDTSQFAPQVAGQDPAQAAAYAQATTAGQGIGAYEPYMTQAGAYTGPGSQAAFMSPYQTDVIKTTMDEYDIQAGKGLSGIGQLAAQSGNLGGGREGVMRSEYQNKSDLNRALLLAGLQQQGFGQAQKGAQQAYMNQMQMGQALPAWQAADVAGLGSMGATQQAQAQAQLGATQEANRLAAYEPYERLGYQGQGIASIASGMPGQYQSQVTPDPTPLQTALGTGSILSGIWGNIRPGGTGGSFPTYNPLSRQ